MEAGEPHPASEPALLGGVDLDGEEVVQELRVSGLLALGRLQRGWEMLGDRGELQIGQVRAEVLIAGVLVHR